MKYISKFDHIEIKKTIYALIKIQTGQIKYWYWHGRYWKNSKFWKVSVLADFKCLTG